MADDGTREYEGGRPLSFAKVNCFVASTPFPVVSMAPFAPYHAVKRSEPFVPRNAGRGAVHGIKALKRLKMHVGGKQTQRSELTIITGHSHGHMMVWSGENLTLHSAGTHFNNASVVSVVVATTMIYTIVEKDILMGGKSGDDCDIYVWNIATMELEHHMSGHEDRVTCIAVDEANEYFVASGSVDRQILLWDVKVAPVPKTRLLGHTSTVAKLLLSDQILYSAGAEGAIRVWDIAAGTCLATLEGHQASITHMLWSSPLTPDFPSGSFLTACTGGTIKSWSVDNRTRVTNVWSTKAHKALTTDLCHDGAIVVSSSATDGVNLYHSEAKKNVKYGFLDTGVRNLAIDPSRKLIVAGTDNGQLTVLSYQGLAHPSSDAAEVTVFAALQPHLGSITSILIERSQNGQWERLITASNDHCLAILDFDVNRDSRSFTGYVARTACQILHTGTLLVPYENSGHLFDPVEMSKKTGMQKTLEGHTRRITCCRYSPEFAKVITGAEDGSVRTSDVLFFSEPEMQHEELLEACDSINVGMGVRCLSKPQRFLIAAGLQKFGGAPGQVSKAGGVAILSFTRGVAVGQTIATFLFPTAVELLSWEQGSERILHFTVVVQLRNGELLTFNGDEEGRFGPTRTIMREQIPYSPERELDGGVPMPTTFKARMNSKYSPPRIELLTVEGFTNFRSFDVTDTGASSTFISNSLHSEILDFQVVNQGEFFIAFALSNSDAIIINAKGETVLSIGYDGSVVDESVEAVRPMRRRRSFIKSDDMGGGSTRFPAACTVSASAENRYIAIGYRDGAIQLVDVPSRRVCRRIHAHGTAVARIVTLTQAGRFVSFSSAGVMRCDTIYPRNVRESAATPPPEPLRSLPEDHQVQAESRGGAQQHKVRIAAHKRD